MKKRVLLLFSVMTILTGCFNNSDNQENNIDQNDDYITEENNIHEEFKDISIEKDEVEIKEDVQKEPEYLIYEDENNFFELPLKGATGYATIDINVRSEPTSSSELLMSIEKGNSFIILEEVDSWWKISVSDKIGYIFHEFAMINLPDVLPSAIYYNTNATASVMKSSYLDLPNITGEKLYSAHSYNERLGYDEYIMPVLYSTAKKIANAQSFALAEGNSLLIVELYRPYETQQKVVSSLTEASRNNQEILNGITSEPWSMSWFIATSLSNHQRGYAIDTSLATILEMETIISGDYQFEKVKNYDEFEMQTPIHELSYRSASLSYPMSNKNITNWEDLPTSENFTNGSYLLREYCMKAGLMPLASEWWHFDDLDNIGKSKSVGDFYIDNILSIPPLI